MHGTGDRARWLTGELDEEGGQHIGRVDKAHSGGSDMLGTGNHDDITERESERARETYRHEQSREQGGGVV